MKKIIIIFSALLFALLSCKVEYNSSGSGNAVSSSSDSVVYAGFIYQNSTSKLFNVGYYNKGSWNEYSNPYNSSCLSSGLILHDSSVYSPGACMDTSGISRAGYWKDGKWNELSDGTNHALALCMTFDPDGNVLAGGWQGDGTKEIAGYWDTTGWHPHENPYASDKFSATIGIIVSTAGTITQCIINKIDDSNYTTEIYSGSNDISLYDASSIVNCCAVNGDTSLYCAGQKEGKFGIYKDDASTFIEPVLPTGYTLIEIADINCNASSVYYCGACSDSSGNIYACYGKLDGTEGVVLSAGSSNTMMAGEIHFYNGDMCISGSTEDGSAAGYWNNTGTFTEIKLSGLVFTANPIIALLYSDYY